MAWGEMKVWGRPWCGDMISIKGIAEYMMWQLPVVVPSCRPQSRHTTTCSYMFIPFRATLNVLWACRWCFNISQPMDIVEWILKQKTETVKQTTTAEACISSKYCQHHWKKKVFKKPVCVNYNILSACSIIQQPPLDGRSFRGRPPKTGEITLNPRTAFHALLIGSAQAQYQIESTWT